MHQGYEQPQSGYEQGQQVVVVNQHNSYDRNYAMPRAICPGALMIVCGVLNLIVLIVLGAMSGGWVSEYIAGTVIFLACGIVALIGSAGSRQKTSQGPPIALIVLSVVSLSFSGTQIILRAMGILAGAIIVTVNTNDPAANQLVDTIGTIVLWTSVGLIVIAVLGFILSIVLLVFASKVLCGCCGAPNGQSNKGVVYQNKA
ncbi:uncharacterized protein LOC135488270 [Lineus longissimus]|uniref:uncharacterized protein LOC135488270 n=1 Tax=Lineus longissimus TaxID=88925 RepID=UPI00315C6E0A